VKKAGVQHPLSSDLGNEETDRENVVEGSGSWSVSLIIASILVVPITFIVLLTVCLRLYRTGKLSCGCRKNSNKNRRFSPGSLLGRHNGFSLLTTMDKYHSTMHNSAANQELDLLNSEEDEGESEVEEFTSPATINRA